MNIVIGKIGKSVLFDTNKHGSIGGDVDAPLLFKNLAKYNPDINFYMLGKSDLKTYKGVDIPKNIINVWKHFKMKNDTDENTYWPIQYFKDIKIDGGIFVGGPTGSFSIKNKIKSIRNYPDFAKPIDQLVSYVSPIVHYLNESGIPWINILHDPRYYKIGRDCFNRPSIYLSQYMDSFYEKHIPNYNNQHPDELVISKSECVYAEQEKAFFLERAKQPLREKDIKMMIVMNSGKNGGMNRYKELKKYILDDKRSKDVAIYGNWDEDIIASDSRFKGSLKFTELQKKLPRVKYTFIVPIKEGWVTAKFWEMVHFNIIPFMHSAYDDQGHIKVSKFLRVKDADDLYNKIDYLESNPLEYEKIIKHLQALVKDSDYNGLNLNNIIMRKFFDIINKTYEDKTESVQLVKKLSVDDFL